jgi:sugar-specific transcriptional regulator TrmB
MSKLDEILEVLEEPGGEKLTNPVIGERVGCTEAHVRRARKVLQARRLVEEQGGLDSSEAAHLLGTILRADEAEELIRDALAEAKDEVKVLRGQLKEMVAEGASARKAARENYPLFDKAKDEAEAEADASPDASARPASKRLALAGVG